MTRCTINQIKCFCERWSGLDNEIALTLVLQCFVIIFCSRIHAVKREDIKYHTATGKLQTTHIYWCTIQMLSPILHLPLVLQCRPNWVSAEACSSLSCYNSQTEMPRCDEAVSLKWADLISPVWNRFFLSQQSVSRKAAMRKVSRKGGLVESSFNCKLDETWFAAQTFRVLSNCSIAASNNSLRS